MRDFLADLLSRKVTDRENIVARAEELGCDLAAGARGDRRPRPARSTPRRATGARACSTVAERGARAVERSSLAATIALGPPRPLPHGAAGDRGRRGPTASS